METQKEGFCVKAEVTLESTLEISMILSSLSLERLKRRRDFHCTLVFAESWNKNPTLRTMIKDVYYKVIGVRKMDNTAVALILSGDDTSDRYLETRNLELIKEMEAVETFPNFLPHITIGYLPPGVESLDDSEKEILEKAFVGKTVSFIREVGKIIRC